MTTKDLINNIRICKYCGMELSEGIPHGLRECHLRAVARIAELEEKQRWIPVSERLPEDGKPVWVCTIWNEQHSGFLIDGVWGGLFRDFREGEITHWMPLPPNPESPNDTQTQTIVYGKEGEE